MKKLLSLFLAQVMAAALAVPACAVSHTATAEESAQILYNLGLFKGNGDLPDGTPTFELDRAPTRAEAVIMLVRLLGQEKEALSSNYATPFTDVPDWAQSYIGYAYQNKLAFGVHSTSFGSYEPVTAAQFLTYLLRALGYKDNEDFYWETSWTLADRLGISDGQYNKNSGPFLRGDAALTAANALFTARKGTGKTLLSQLTEAGAVVMWDCNPVALKEDYAAFLFYPTSGSSSFTSFKLTNVTVNGKACDLFQLTSPTAVSSYLAAAGYDKTGFCYAEMDYDKSVAVAYNLPGGSFPLLSFSFRYLGTLPNGNTVKGTFSYSYYLDQ